MKQCTQCKRLQPAGAECSRCRGATLDVSEVPTIRFEPRARLATTLEISCFGASYAIGGRLLLKWWHEIAIACYRKALHAEMWPQNLLTLSPLCNYLLFGEPGDISTYDGEDHEISIGKEKIYLLANLFTDCTASKDASLYAKCAKLIGAPVKRAPSYHEFALYYAKRAGRDGDEAIAEHLLDVLAGKGSPRNIVEALFLGATLGSELLRNRTSYIDTMLCLKLVRCGVLTMSEIITGGPKKARQRISEIFAIQADHYPDLKPKLTGMYVLCAPGVRAARCIRELRLEPGNVEIQSTDAHDSGKTEVASNCWLDVANVVSTYDKQGSWAELTATTCNGSQLGGALPMTGHNTQSLGTNALLQSLLDDEIGFTQVQAKTVTNIIRMLHHDCDGASFNAYFHGAFSKAVSKKIVSATSDEVSRLIQAFIRQQMIEMVLDSAAVVPAIDDLTGTHVQDYLETLTQRFPDLA